MFVIGMRVAEDSRSFELVQGEIIDKQECKNEDGIKTVNLLLSDDALVIEYMNVEDETYIVEHRKGSINFESDAERTEANNSVEEIRCPHCNKLLGYKGSGFFQTKCLRCKNIVRFW